MSNFMTKTLVTLFFISIALTLNAQIPAAANTCIACHGPSGVSNNSLWPNLAGQKKDYLEKQMREFKSGARKDPLMSPISQLIQENDIAVLADYFANLKP